MEAFTISQMFFFFFFFFFFVCLFFVFFVVFFFFFFFFFFKRGDLAANCVDPARIAFRSSSIRTDGKNNVALAHPYHAGKFCSKVG